MPKHEKEEKGSGGTLTGIALDPDATVSVICGRIGKLLMKVSRLTWDCYTNDGGAVSIWKSTEV